VVGLVLRHTRRKVLQPQLDRLPVAVERIHADVGVARHHAADVGDAEAAFPSLRLRVGDRNDLGIDDDHRLAVRPGLVVEQRHEQTQSFVDLRARQADTVIFVHGVDHVVDQLLDERIAQIRLLQRPGPLAEHGMSHARDFQDGHDYSVTEALARLSCRSRRMPRASNPRSSHRRDSRFYS
jgi:hypothetical protein